MSLLDLSPVDIVFNIIFTPIMYLLIPFVIRLVSKKDLSRVVSIIIVTINACIIKFLFILLGSHGGGGPMMIWSSVAYWLLTKNTKFKDESPIDQEVLAKKAEYEENVRSLISELKGIDVADNDKESKVLVSESNGGCSCHNCGQENIANSMYCRRCGHKLIKLEKCPKCGQKIQDGSLFCRFCGTKLDTGLLNKKADKNKKTLFITSLILILGLVVPSGCYAVSSGALNLAKESNSISICDISIGSRYKNVKEHLDKYNISYRESESYSDNIRIKKIYSAYKMDSGNLADLVYVFDQDNILKRVEFSYKDRVSKTKILDYICMARDGYGVDDYTRSGIDSYTVYGNKEKAVITQSIDTHNIITYYITITGIV